MLRYHTTKNSGVTITELRDESSLTKQPASDGYTPGKKTPGELSIVLTSELCNELSLTKATGAGWL